MKKLFSLLTFVLLIVAALSFQSCSNDGKMTVWTETDTYAEFQAAFDTDLNDGYYIRWELTEDQWKQVTKNLSSQGKHRWNEEEIRTWLIGNGFGQTEATKESSWLTMVNHGFLVTRDGNLVYMILK